MYEKIKEKKKQKNKKKTAFDVQQPSKFEKLERF